MHSWSPLSVDAPTLDSLLCRGMRKEVSLLHGRTKDLEDVVRISSSDLLDSTVTLLVS